MAQLDFSVTSTQYTNMMTVLDGIRTKLSANKPVLSRICAQEAGRVKIKAFAQTEDGKWLKEIALFRRQLDQYFEDVAWGEDD